MKKERKEIGKRKSPDKSGLFLYINDWRREPESNRPKRLCRPLHNRFAIAPQADWNLNTDSQIYLAETRRTEALQRSERPVFQTKREALLPLMYGAGDEARTRDLNLG